MADLCNSERLCVLTIVMTVVAIAEMETIAIPWAIDICTVVV